MILSPKSFPNQVIRKLFFRTSAKTEKCVWIEPARTDCIWAHPLEGSGRPKNRRKMEPEFGTVLFGQKIKIFQKRAPKSSPKGWLRNGGGASWATFGTPVCFLIRKVLPKWSKSDPKMAKWPPKVNSKRSNWLQNSQNLNLNEWVLKLDESPAEFSECCNYVPGPADCAKRFQ